MVLQRRRHLAKLDSPKSSLIRFPISLGFFKGFPRNPSQSQSLWQMSECDLFSHYFLGNNFCFFIPDNPAQEFGFRSQQHSCELRSPLIGNASHSSLRCCWGDGWYNVGSEPPQPCWEIYIMNAFKIQERNQSKRKQCERRCPNIAMICFLTPKYSQVVNKLL